MRRVRRLPHGAHGHAPGGAGAGAPPLAAANFSLRLVAIEPVPANVRILREGLLAHVEAAARAARDARVALRVEAFAVVGAEGVDAVQFGVCPPGHEVCGVKREGVPGEGGGGPGAYEVGTVSVAAATLDAWAAREGLLGGGAAGAEGGGVIDVLAVDTEGLDALVLAGGARLLAQRRVRLLLFEYHNFRAWATTLLEDVVRSLDGHGFDCYLLQQRLALRLTGCWHAAFEFHYWSNVACVLRSEEALAAALAAFANIPLIEG